MIISDEVRNAIVDAAGALVNGGDMLFREGATPLLTFSLKTPAFSAAADGDGDLDVLTPTMNATATDDAIVALDNYQIRTSGGAVRCSGDIGEIGSGAEIEMNHLDVVEGDVVTINSYTLTMPDGS